MKLSTMLLPTGEFILIGSGTAQPLPPPEIINNLTEKTGAVAVLFTEQSVEVEDALFDENARRAEVEEDTDELMDVICHDGATRVLRIANYWGQVDDSDESREFSPYLLGQDFSPTEGDINLTRQILDGAEFSPAGLVTNGPKSQADLEPELEAALAERPIDAEKLKEGETDG